MQLDILTLFPGIFEGFLSESIVKRAIEKKILSIFLHQIRDYATDKHHTTDDLPYGGGAGMVMKWEPLYGAWQAAKEKTPETKMHTIYLSPQGKPLTQRWLEETAKNRKNIILVCGRYEGVDERFLEECVDEEISLGDFVLSGGEVPAMALIDGLMRLLPGVLGNEASAQSDSFSLSSGEILEYPQYTRPPEWLDKKVPEILLSGDHARIARWRKEQALERTKKRRPDLLASMPR